MPEALTTYLLFLAETVTVVVALAAVLVAAAVVRRRGLAVRRPRLRVENLTEHYEELAQSLQVQLLPRKAARQRRRADRKLRRQRDRAGVVGPARPRLFVIDFRGDPRALGVEALREEVTAVLSTATRQDEVLVRLRNPGGFVHEQGFAASQLLRVRARAIPLTVAVDTVAASGGYMMACVADRIVAAPFAVVGSIGVVTQIPNLNRLLDRHGVDVEQFTGGEFKRTVTVLGRTTDADREKLQAQVQDVHALFKEWVAQHRPQLDLARVATGEYWYGTRALELGLVDELTTSDDYLTAARDRADIYLVSYTPPRSPAQRLAALLTRASRGL